MPPRDCPRLDGWLRFADGTRLRLNVVRAAADGVERPLLAVPGDDLVVLLQLRLGSRFEHGEHDLVVDLLRGDEPRDQWRHVVDGTEMDTAFRLTWSARAPASSRLQCRVLLDGVELARRTVLLGQPRVDAQGRLAPETVPNASEPTLLAYLDEFRREMTENG